MPQAQPSCSLLLETIKIKEGKIYNLPYHQKRCDQSRQTLFQSTDPLTLSSIIQPPKSGFFRCRILYADALHSVEYIPYVPKEIHSLKIIPSEIDYAFKYANRAVLNALLDAHREVDEVIIEKQGYLTDTTIANIAFYDGKQWFTPKNPLLRGTMRANLLDKRALQTREIKKEDLHKYTQVALMNAMIGFKVLNINSISM